MLFNITVTKQPATYEITAESFSEAYKYALSLYETDPETTYNVSGAMMSEPQDFSSKEVKSIVSKMM